MNNSILRNAFVTFTSFIFVISVVSAWTAPTQTAPNGNVSAPVTISASDQEKFGGLTVASLLSTGGIRAFGRVQVGSTTVACAPEVAGSLRWNAGAMEHCNGTAWLPFTGGVSTITGGTCPAGQFAQSISTSGVPTCVASVTGGGCGVGQVVKSISTTGVVTCAASTSLSGLIVGGCGYQGCWGNCSGATQISMGEGNPCGGSDSNCFYASSVCIKN